MTFLKIHFVLALQPCCLGLWGLQRGDLILIVVSHVCFQGQCRHSSRARQGHAGAGRPPGQSEEGADEGGLSGAHFGAKGQSEYLSSDVKSYESIHANKYLMLFQPLFNRTKRSRS